MNNQKPDSKSGDHEDGDHYQPINLVAARTAVPVTFSATCTTVTSQPLAMRTHNLDNKPGLMTLYFRTQAPRTQGQVMGPIVGTQVSSSQHFAAKSAPDFKNTTSFTVIRMPSDLSQVQGGTTTSSSSSLTPGILPTALSGGSTRHMIPTAVQPVIAAGHTGPSLASLIRGSHQVSPAGHVIHPPFPSHVPRGPAAVASISAAPKSAVATPILRTPHSSGTMALASSSMMALHTPVRVKSPTITGRTATPPVVSTTSMPQVVDLQKSSIGHTLSSSSSHVGLSSRSIDGSIARTGNSHSSSITITKPVNISQPIVQHLQQQIYEKGNIKTVANLIPTTTTPSNSSHQSTSVFTSVNETSGVPTISRTPVSSSYSSIMQLPSSNIAQPLQQLRTTHIPQGMHAVTTVSSSGTSHQTLTVIAAKSLMPTNHSIALATSTPRSATPVTTASAASGNISIVPGPTSRSLTLTNAITPASIPVAKVYPQSTTTARTTTESTTQENIRNTSFITQGLVSSTARVTAPTTTTSSGTSSSISDKQSENTPVRFTSLSKSQSGNSSYTPSSTTYLYHDQYASNLTMHHYNSNSSSSNFTTTQLRPVSFSQHSSSNTSSHSSISVSNPVMVAVDSRHHMSLHSSYSSNSGKGSDLSTPTSLSTSVTTTASLPVTSTVSTTYSTLQSQSTVNNHTSPRPSILRKRPSDSICSIAKKNLSASLGGTEPVSPRPDISTNINFTSVLSPKPANSSSDKSKEVQPPSAPPPVSESQNVLIPVIPAATVKKESIENSSSSTDALVKDTRSIEASPRKKPRKQLLATNELLETHSSDGEENNFDVKMKAKEATELKEDEKSKCITFYKRPSMSLLSAYRQTWKARHNHFARYSDVKPKEEKKPTVSELANQKGILQQANGWKIYHLTAQMDEVIELEETVYSRLSDLLDFVENDSPFLKNWNSLNTDEVRIINKLTDLIKGNLQRSKIVQEQVSESKQQAIKVLDHKTNVMEIINKYISKRPLKKKEKS